MRLTFKIVGFCLLTVTGYCLLAFSQEQTPTAVKVKEKLVLQADSLLTAINRLQTAHAKDLQLRFRQLRLAYKRLEWAAEYFDPVTTRIVNGPPVPEVEPDGLVIQPDGLQVIEELLFPRYNPTSKKSLDKLLASLATNAGNYKSYFARTDLQDWRILDAVKLEVFKIETLGLNDFDDPLARQCFAESSTALQSIQAVTGEYQNLPEFSNAIRYLLKPVAFNSFDRAKFLTAYANPLTRALTRLRKQLHLPDIRYNRLLNQDAATLFDQNAFNRNAYLNDLSDSTTSAKIALGKKLFFDPLLSGTMTRSCSSCHQPQKYFTDGMVKNLDIMGKKPIARNTPTLINAALQAGQFYDLRAETLEDQAGDVVRNRDEMHGDMQLSIGKLWRDSAYRKLFGDAFPVKHRTAIDTMEVMNALAGYIRSLTALNSRFDAYMQGDQNALKKTEVNGFNLFMGKARCSTCHYMPLFNGTLPPRYMQTDAEVIGTPQTKAGKKIDPDLGLYGITPLAFTRHAFKVTSVRNTAQTAPYMHNGVFKTLDEVIDFYNKGGGAGIGLKVPNQTLSTDKLNLTLKERRELIAFIKSLDSR
ncbi:MAG: cytochrome c peroxidase [Bacteroidota bacterium]